MFKPRRLVNGIQTIFIWLTVMKKFVFDELLFIFYFFIFYMGGIGGDII